MNPPFLFIYAMFNPVFVDPSSIKFKNITVTRWLDMVKGGFLNYVPYFWLYWHLSTALSQ